jgi:hypothetical protein
MTNAYVERMAKATDGDAVIIRYKDGEKKILVTPETVIAAVAPGGRADIKPGARVIIFASEKQADGSLLAKVMYVGRYVAPAM